MVCRLLVVRTCTSALVFDHLTRTETDHRDLIPAPFEVWEKAACLPMSLNRHLGMAIFTSQDSVLHVFVGIGTAIGLGLPLV